MDPYGIGVLNPEPSEYPACSIISTGIVLGRWSWQPVFNLDNRSHRSTRTRTRTHAQTHARTHAHTRTHTELIGLARLVLKHTSILNNAK